MRIVLRGLAGAAAVSLLRSPLDLFIYYLFFFFKNFLPLWSGRPADIFNRLSGFFGQRDARGYFSSTRRPSQTLPFRSAFICSLSLYFYFFFQRYIDRKRSETERSTNRDTWKNVIAITCPATIGEGCPRRFLSFPFQMYTFYTLDNVHWFRIIFCIIITILYWYGTYTDTTRCRENRIKK